MNRPTTLDVPRDRRAAFTLVEIVIAITIVAILVGMAIPTMRGLEREKVAREPVSELLRLARTVRARAMAEQQPYQIAFDHRGFHAARYFNPYGESEEFDELVRELDVLEEQRKIAEASRARGVDLNSGREPTVDDRAAQTIQAGLEYHESYEIPDGVTYRLWTWGDTEWIDMQSGLFKRWVFQPSGMCQPLKIEVDSDRAHFEVEFHPLTGDVRSEKSWVE
ncbi:MAG: prepilin-type N-terminal cleavage/methylation domain-containing protein [Verrucomicrobiae bacterium]|nr:prepilin-type N-terminal cleavage/methylation domain-containing protein [Verrucomicrobiae bacterium]MCP5541884.1 prepilin-type N-terminal cleavage/methylation domain-containing protein [Akkermansiaceae bacterium]